MAQLVVEMSRLSFVFLFSPHQSGSHGIISPMLSFLQPFVHHHLEKTSVRSQRVQQEAGKLTDTLLEGTRPLELIGSLVSLCEVHCTHSPASTVSLSHQCSILDFCLRGKLVGRLVTFV